MFFAEPKLTSDGFKLKRRGKVATFYKKLVINIYISLCF